MDAGSIVIYFYNIYTHSGIKYDITPILYLKGYNICKII
jgi:hypothetical protein